MLTLLVFQVVLSKHNYLIYENKQYKSCNLKLVKHTLAGHTLAGGGWRWVVVGGVGHISAGCGSWWMMVGRGGHILAGGGW